MLRHWDGMSCTDIGRRFKAWQLPKRLAGELLETEDVVVTAASRCTDL